MEQVGRPCVAPARARIGGPRHRAGCWSVEMAVVDRQDQALDHASFNRSEVNMNEMTVNPFESQRAVAEMSGARAAQARESTEVLALLYGARQNTRDPIKACDRIRNAFTRVGLAEESQYSYQRGGTDIAGPSIRAAEAIRLDWGNMATGWRVVSRSIDPDGVGVSEVE